jgi:hypothetical protein
MGSLQVMIILAGDILNNLGIQIVNTINTANVAPGTDFFEILSDTTVLPGAVPQP